MSTNSKKADNTEKRIDDLESKINELIDLIVNRPHSRKCATMDVHERLLETEPDYRKNRQEIEKFTQHYKERRVGSGLRSGIVRIPVVVHVVYNTSLQNISDAQIQSQIDILNRDFRRLNTDAGSVPGVFDPVAADARIEFQLAVRDPNCNPTNGITRTSTTTASFTDDDRVKSSSTGGRDPWPRDRYLNIWVCNLRLYLGYAQFPGGPAATDGVVVTYTAFGDTGTATSPFHLGRTATHEIGHWLNLIHIWADDCGLPDPCSGSDMVDDTPNQACERYGCPSFPQISCNNGPNGDMFMNYMDYTNDACMFMFTAGQSTRMDATLYGPRSSIVASDGLIPPTSSPTADLWSQDTTEDIGTEPNTISPHMWQSDDIWVRKQNDGLINQEHQNPEYREPGFGSNFVYVRIRNKVCNMLGSGIAKLYWAKASTTLGWPAPWNGTVTSPALMGGLIGSQSSGNIPAGGSVILEFPWYAPNPADYSSFGADKSHFCLLSRIETSSTTPFGMTFPEGPNLEANVRNNNNIIWKNITVVDEFPGAGRIGWITVGGISEEDIPMKFLFTIPIKRRRSIFEWGMIKVDLGEKLFEKWKNGDSIGEGIAQADKYSIYILEDSAWIGNIRLNIKDLYTIMVQLTPYDRQIEGNDIFFLNLAQHKFKEKEGEDSVIGGQTFIIKTIASLKDVKGKKPTLVFDGAEWVPALASDKDIKV